MESNSCASKKLESARLYTFVDTAYLRGRDPVEVARQLCAGGSDIIQLRAKNFSFDETLRLAEKIVPITDAAGVPLVINDHPKIAQQIGAAFCHLGQEDFFDARFKTVSEIFPSTECHIGLSTHAPEQAVRALAANPAYIAIGPIYATPTKPTAKPVTLQYIRWAKANVPIPWFAIGGINLKTIGDVLEAGAQRICVVSAILNADDISGATREFKNILIT